MSDIYETPNRKISVQNNNKFNSFSNISRDVLKEGGTAVDAAIASLVCNGAVHSHSSGLGGGYFMTIFIKAENKTYFLNAKETAPRYATENMFVNTSADSRKGKLCLILIEIAINF